MKVCERVCAYWKIPMEFFKATPECFIPLMIVSEVNVN